ncbi:MAG: autotransporter-associated beta strand repeat-containing protein [Planctomycetales bacterium]|nr:autotransporter-associated beta strand repeat-containing protein [Planctomycetales bacterium]
MYSIFSYVRLLSVVLSCFAIHVASPSQAMAASFTWTGNGPGSDWDAAGGFPTFATNWVSGGNITLIPGSSDTVLFNSGSTGTITVLLNGTRTVTSATLQGSNPITITESLLQLTSGALTASPTSNGYQIQSDVLLFSSGSWNVSGGSNGLTVSGDISGATLSKSGSGTLILTGNNTYSGTTSVTGGTLQIGNGGSTGSIVANLANGSGVTFNRSGTLTYGGIISGSGPVAKQGSGTLILTGNSTSTGLATVSNGTLQIGNGGTTGSILGNIINNTGLSFNRSDTLTYSGTISGSGSVSKLGAGTLILTGNSSSTGTKFVNSGTLQIGNGGTTGSILGNIVNDAAVVFNRGSALTYSGDISGLGALSKLGAGTLTLTGSNSYSGTTTINGGTLQIGSGGSAGSIAGNVVNNTGLIFNRSNDLTYSGVISGGGPLTKLGGGTLTLTGNNTLVGTKTISGGVLQIGDGGVSGSIAGNLINDSNVSFNRSDSLLYTGVITGVGSLTKLGAGTLTLTGNNSYSGGTSLSDGTLSISADNHLGSPLGSLTALGGGLRVTSSHATSRDFVLSSGLSIDIPASVTYTANGLFMGTSLLTKTGAGTLILKGANTDVSDKSIDAGVLQVGDGGTTGTLTGNTLNNATLAFNRADDIAYGGDISGTGNLVKQGAGKLTLTGSNTYSGDTSIEAGVMAVSADANLGSGGQVTISGSTLLVSATHTTSRDFQLQDVATIEVESGQSYTVDGTLSSTGNLVKNGDGELVLSGLNTYSGGTTVSGGTLSLDSTNSLGSGPLNILAGGVAVTGPAVLGVPGVTAPSSVSIGVGSLFSTPSDKDTTIGFSGNVVLAGGTLSSRRVNAGLGSQLSGSGIVNARILADTGSSITATGSLDLGNPSEVNGFYSNGDLELADNTVTLHDSNGAVFDSGAFVDLGSTGAGTLAAANGLTLDFGGNIVGRGTISSPNDGTKPLINNGSISGNSLTELITLTGYVKGVGTCDFCDITGTDAPGFSPAAVNRGSVSYNGILEIEIGGTSPGSSFDQLNHVLGLGIADLGGALDVELINGFTPSAGDSFEILTATSVLGVFDSISLPALSGDLQWFVNYGATSVELVTTFAADFDEDGNVDGDDFNSWQGGFGNSPAAHMTGDANADNAATGFDFLEWQRQFGSGFGAISASQAIPEPTTAAMLMGLAAASLIARRRF